MGMREGKRRERRLLEKVEPWAGKGEGKGRGRGQMHKKKNCCALVLNVLEKEGFWRKLSLGHGQGQRHKKKRRLVVLYCSVERACFLGS
jgi:hypothetical protein